MQAATVHGEVAGGTSRRSPGLDAPRPKRSDPRCMMHEVRSIPPAPRRVRFKSLVAHRWPLLAVGGTLVVLGLLIAWLMFLQSGGKMSDGARLDRDPKAVVDGHIKSVRHAGTWDGRQWDWV